MSAFIVISIQNHLHQIVDGIEKCRPQNHDVTTFISTGKLVKKDDKFFYEYTCGEEKEERESNELYQLLTNQFAHFRNISEKQDKINIFILDNPLKPEDFQMTKWINQEIKTIYNSRTDQNFEIVRVLFSYDVQNPTNINLQIATDILPSLQKEDQKLDLSIKTFYLDNQDRVGAAICTNKKEHDLMLPRMLCDFMMLYSSVNDSYDVISAVNSDTNIFSIGYAECMYYFDDIKRFYEIANKKIILNYILNASALNDSLDYERYPIGLLERERKLSERYKSIPYNVDIKTKKENVDAEIDSIIIKLEEYIKEIKREALEIARKEDEKLNLKKQLEDGNIEKDICTKNEDYVLQKYPDFISRESIYEWCIVTEDSNNALENNNEYLTKINAYENLIKFIQQSEFKKFIQEKEKQIIKQHHSSTNLNATLSTNKGCNIFGWFFKKKIEKTIDNDIAEIYINKSNVGLNDIQKLSNLLKEKNEFCSFQKHIKEITYELENIDSEINNFKLTSHCKSCSSLIDVSKLKKFHQENKSNFESDIFTNKNLTFSLINSLCKKKTEEIVKKFLFIDWEHPFEFVVKPDIKTISQKLITKSVPFINTYTTLETKENLTSYMFYSDNSEWIELIKKGKIIFSQSLSPQAKTSSHIASKICMFQLLQMSDEIIKGLVDNYRICK